MIIDPGFFYGNLAEGILDVRVLPIGRRNKSQLAGQRISSAQTIDLTAVRTAEQGQQHPVPLGRIHRQFFFQQIHAFARTAAKDHTVYFSCFVIHTTVLPSV